jgi:arginyl-tRNA synthetase
MLERTVRKAVDEALGAAFPGAPTGESAYTVEVPREKDHGDYAANAAMVLAKPLRRSPRAIAEALLPRLAARADLFASVEIAGPGFLNLRLAPPFLQGSLSEIGEAGPRWGESDDGKGEKIQVEFVSANPTGPLNVVNARAAAFGATLTRLLRRAGYDARSEFYVNDVGGQIALLGASLLARVREVRGDGPAAIPEGGYQGEYLLDLAREMDAADVDRLLAAGDERSQVAAFGRAAVDRIVAWQKKDLEAYGVTFDRWFHQRTLYPEGVARTRRLLDAAGHLEEREGAAWFVSTRFGDDQDRVVVRQTGEPTYFLADLAYHETKHERGFARVVDIWGPDHHGYIARMKAGMEALGYGKDWLEILLVQQVNLLSGGKPAKMSKRRGEFITLLDLLEEVGKDAAIFFFLMRRAESHLDFDIDLAKKAGDENPVYYVKYAHARLSGILRKAEEEGAPGPEEPADLSLLEDERELALMKILLVFPETVAGAAREREPHRLTGYLRETAQAFHLFYHHCRVVGPDRALSAARLTLTRAARTVLANGLALLDIEAPERM